MSITSRQFIRKAYKAALLRDPTPQELARARSSLNVSYSVGGSALLNDAKARLKALLTSTEYVARSTDDDTFITDTFGAYLDRLPSSADLTFYEDYLDTPYTRAQMLDAVGLATEFIDRVDTIVPVGIYPSSDKGGPVPLKILKMPEDVDQILLTHTYEDGGISTVLTADLAPQQWEITYDGLDEAEAAILDEHYRDAMAEAWPFTYIDRDGTEWANTRYVKQGLGVDHSKTWVQARHVKLIWRP
jgi:hypothetical protein